MTRLNDQKENVHRDYLRRWSLFSWIKAICYFVFDSVASVFVFFALPLLWLTRKYGVEHFPFQRLLFKKMGVFPIRDHYYEPRFSYPENFTGLAGNTFEQNGPGLDNSNSFFDSNALGVIKLMPQLIALKELNHVSELNELPSQKGFRQNEFYVHNPNFGAGDSEMYYLMVRNKQPKTIIEIGSGYSTQLCLKALEKNRTEGNACNLICIEPFEMPYLNQEKGITLIRKKVEEVSLDLFQALEENDILFIDSSHIIRPGNDVLHIYFQILPALKKGVVIHIHDIFSPNHYPISWLTEKMRFWNEQYLLEAFLYKNESFKVLFALNYLTKQAFEETKNILIHLQKDSEPSSFWMQKIAD